MISSDLQIHDVNSEFVFIHSFISYFIIIIIIIISSNYNRLFFTLKNGGLF